MVEHLPSVGSAAANGSSAHAPDARDKTKAADTTPEDGRKQTKIESAQAPDDKEKDAGKDDKSTASGKKPSKRRKVNHACVYCRRSHMTCDLERPCARCIKRDIGHLCHDEPREPPKRTKSELELGQADNKTTELPSAADGFNGFVQNDSSLGMIAGGTIPGSMEAPPIAQPKPLSPSLHRPQSNDPNFMPFNNNQWDFGNSTMFTDMQNLHPYNTFNTSEVNNEYNMLGDFLNSSLLDDGGMYSADDAQAFFNDPLLTTGAANNLSNLGIQNATQPSGAQTPAQAQAQAQAGSEISRPSSAFPTDAKAREKFFLTAADPAGNDAPEERMNRLLKAKYDAGMLKPFNYAKGYARLYAYMEKHMRQTSKQKIKNQLERFRPKFRDAMHTLSDVQLVKVEMWFERCLMEYDRVFASMAIPACCWRRTGEIYRGNKEMAELIHVPMENLRDGRITLHEIMAEDSLVSYWDKFGAIAFDQSQKAILTSCSLRNPDPKSKDPLLRCCFSFTIRRDTHNIPALIVGNFLPIQPE
ncbi:hypothetical protein K461DRAFT_285686 [Myriangium duriaei CBS 260.36]|uniref:Zn(2)-C6 fungal-type domain-containing protein n=1 Tax=Myriangium duriaei CBS 260.36 TaxID=1168546 RepID=A0A9P4J6U3_9PEZI|nr:hypothetical protein K461DRAFT_285686 [Myriangium duriaei CBS 260.36]